ncbi:TrkH-domain-containing protein [Aureobasidium pullulans]|nr:TrkH-domain-containing protein [Aureobasidium pullulans]THZ10075.1 TrkH-domain-containing protein [Aureobasidium pullulans]TIA24481.1 TrkH-domain-containing protein [Aureobasidium pullulans]
MLGRRLKLRFARPLRAIRRALPPVNFITLHYAYFMFTCLLAAVIFWASSTDTHVEFTDALFLCVSAMTEAGLNTVNLSELNTWQQIMLFALIFVGSAIFVSNFVLQVRRRAFERKFISIIESRKRKQRRNSSRGSAFSMSRLSISRSRENQNPNLGLNKSNSTDVNEAQSPVRRGRASISKNSLRLSTSKDTDGASDRPNAAEDELNDATSPDRITFSPETVFRSQKQQDDQISPTKPRHRVFSVSGVGARSEASLHRVTSVSRTSVAEEGPAAGNQSTADYFPSSGYISRNSTFHNLTEAERQKLGGVEYKALLWLSWIVPLYLILWQLLGALGCAAWVAYNRPDTARANGLNPWWVGAFNAISAFNNSGMSLLDANMVAFQTSYYLLLTMGVMILAGNTCYPIFLRLIVWTIYKLLPKTARFDDHRNTLRFLLDHPRRCYTNLFPSEHTWWLAFAVFVLNGVDWAAFEILNIGNRVLNDTIPIHIRVLDGLFQAFAVRSGGFYVVSIPTVRISLQVLYVIMMYISVYPVVITMRNSNVYEERSLGVYDENDPDDLSEASKDPNSIYSKFRGIKKQFATGFGGLSEGKSYFLQQQLRAQLAHDAWWIVFAVFLIMIIEGGQFERDPKTFSVFNVIFEVVSGYGTVGISVGVPDNAYSFAGSWHKLSKLILCAVMLRGRHRGLPIAIDRAVLLPNERQDLAEEEDAAIRMERAVSRQTVNGEVV